MRLVIARCSVNYVGRLEAHLPMADRLLLLKADGSVSVHADDRAYKPLNWMTPPLTVTETEDPKDFPEGASDLVSYWIVENKKGEQLRISIEAIHSDISYELGVDPGLVKDGVEAHLQELLADNIEVMGEGYSLIRREYMTPIGPVDILCRDDQGNTIAVEIKRRGGIDGVEQLCRYVELLNRDPLLAPVQGVFAAQSIKPQARTLAEDRGLSCLVLDYNELRGSESSELRLF
ncbi:endonuclease NucS [Corynebacterium sp. ES2775-CONJ]|uniref:endonuclease NucS n=1 Tax=Corynebacterium sp. ES2775-CONJ TaxID=2974029 RepID=UPI002167D5C5|nr:endonuclease NucS [Corynebacterium sp. ES2775-CONJ]MCS4489816.1 endonuclease NucS [Corynebacterium sp. ES2775-CONJ]